jgi:hypothetical protein
MVRSGMDRPWTACGWCEVHNVFTPKLLIPASTCSELSTSMEKPWICGGTLEAGWRRSVDVAKRSAALGWVLLLHGVVWGCAVGPRRAEDRILRL